MNNSIMSEVLWEILICFLYTLPVYPVFQIRYSLLYNQEKNVLK